MKGAGSALMGIGTAKGEDRAVRAAEIAVSSPLLEASIDGAHGVLLLIQGASDLGLHEIDEAARLVQEAVSPEANIIYGTTIDDTLGDEVRITVIAAGFDGGTPVPRKIERSPYASALSTPSASAPAAVASTASATNGWFSTTAEGSNHTAPVTTVPAADEDAAPAAESAISSLFSPSTPKPQTEDGTFGDDLDIPDFLK
jgi:cell division protein FtsZ